MVVVNSVQLYEKNALNIDNEILIMGQYDQKKRKPQDVIVKIIDTMIESYLIVHYDRPDFAIFIKGSSKEFVGKICTIIIDNVVEFRVNLIFPFQNCNINLSEESNIIITMCKNYTSRLDEWIQYNIKLGFDAIIIFDNDGVLKENTNANTNTNADYKLIMTITDKYKDRVIVVDFPYNTHCYYYWNSLQRIIFTLGVNAYKKCSSHVALIYFLYANISGKTNILNQLCQPSIIKIVLSG